MPIARHLTGGSYGIFSQYRAIESVDYKANSSSPSHSIFPEVPTGVESDEVFEESKEKRTLSSPLVVW